MSLRVLSRLPYGNVRSVTVPTEGDTPEVLFAADPHGGPECLWFYFRLTETRPGPGAPEQVKLTLKFFGNLSGGDNAAACRPVYRPEGQGWFRMKSGVEDRSPDGQATAAWMIPYPAPSVEIAFCYPYGVPEVKTLLQKSKGYWRQDEIGLTQGGRVLARLSNGHGSPGGRQPGLYLVARQHSGETPGSWVLDGVLEQFSKSHQRPYLVWAVPLANMDGVVRGDYGRDSFPFDLNRAWGTPPMRHEALVLQRDMQRWRERCQPALAIDFHAPGACETSGIHCLVPDPQEAPEAHKEAEKWANLLAGALGPEFAADDFKRVARYPSRRETPHFSDYARDAVGVCALTVATPYTSCGSTVMTQKKYREAGHRIAKAILQRHT